MFCTNTWREKTLVINQPSTWPLCIIRIQGHCLTLASDLHPTLSSTPPSRSSVLLLLLQSQYPQLECKLLFQSLPHRIAIITTSPKLFATQLPFVLKRIAVPVQEWDGAKRLCESRAHSFSASFIVALSSSPAQNTTSRPIGRRSQSQDSGGIVEKPRSNGKSRSKKGSQYADVIDRLDITGVGPSMSSLLVKLDRLNFLELLSVPS